MYVCSVGFKLSSVAFLLLRLEIAGVIFNPYSTKTPSEFYRIKR